MSSDGIASLTSTSYSHCLVSNIQYRKKKKILLVLRQGFALTWDFLLWRTGRCGKALTEGIKRARSSLLALTHSVLEARELLMSSGT